MIAEAKIAIARWHENADEADEESRDALDTVKEWTIRLSNGEFDETLYWKCAAQDCEEAGDWDGAKAAYQRVIKVNHNSFDQSLGYSSLASLCSILGEDKQALTYYRAASAKELNQVGNIIYRRFLVNKALQLLRMDRIRAARKLATRGLATIETASDDYLNLALLKMVVAQCQLEQRKTVATEDFLTEAWPLLESMREAFEQSGTEFGSGVHSAYCTWWRLEAKRLQITGQKEAELTAWQNSLSHARRGAVGWDRIDWDLAVARTLELLAEAYKRNNRMTESTDALAEAKQIRDRWHLPAIETAPSPKPAYLRLWQTFFPSAN
jgi:tetratricopeptide (TPR) repeat protein